MLIVKDCKTGKTFEIEPGNWGEEKKPGVGYAIFGSLCTFKITCKSPEEDPLFLRYYVMKMENRIWRVAEDREYLFSIDTKPFWEYPCENALAVKLREQGCEVTVKQPEFTYDYNPDVLY